MSDANGDQAFDLLVVGGGINGVGIARDAAGRGLSVLLVERHDLAGATSSASSKLVHGGLRYLEQFEFRLVRESLAEREVLLNAAPHIIRPLRFVLPVHKGLRPPWMLRTGLFLYDHIGGRKRLPATTTVKRGHDLMLDPLKDSFRMGFEYSDCWADDARLVVLNARDAAERGAEIQVGWSLAAARRDGGHWVADLKSESGETRTVRARALVNAGGPWVGEVLGLTGAAKKAHHEPRLVKGSHIVVPRLHDGDQAFTFQNDDGRIAFVVPYEEDFSLIGTTDIPYDDDPAAPVASPQEIDYLCELVSDYLITPVTKADVVWTYSGVRPLYDDGEANASAVTRDYVFDMDAPAGQAPLLSIFGGKLTTYRKLAEHAMADLQPALGFKAGPWTAPAILPGGDLPNADFEPFAAEQVRRYAWAPARMVRRMSHAYGTRLERVMGSATKLADLGEAFSPDLSEAELDHMKRDEWTRDAKAALWRRSKLGLHLSADQQARVAAWFVG
ncbi:MAG: glycerol-3-phosphate dehydrogenase [Caulobacter sp.]|nr:glycerol-3-phosphate dehydrogenase [Caulobacter sp.]